MKLKKRDRRSRLRGTRRSGYGFGKKHRGKGSKGGKGMAGTGKRAGQKLTWVHAKAPDYFGKHGFKSISQMQRTFEVINLDRIHELLDTFMRTGKAKKTAGGIELDLHDYKILGRGSIKDKLVIRAHSASSSAKEAVEKAGGTIITEGTDKAAGHTVQKEKQKQASVKRREEMKAAGKIKK